MVIICFEVIAHTTNHFLQEVLMEKVIEQGESFRSKSHICNRIIHTSEHPRTENFKNTSFTLFFSIEKKKLKQCKRSMDHINKFCS